jgi:hypothetical protein
VATEKKAHTEAKQNSKHSNAHTIHHINKNKIRIYLFKAKKKIELQRAA